MKAISTHCYMFSPYQVPVQLPLRGCTAAVLQRRRRCCNGATDPVNSHCHQPILTIVALTHQRCQQAASQQAAMQQAISDAASSKQQAANRQ